MYALTPPPPHKKKSAGAPNPDDWSMAHILTETSPTITPRQLSLAPISHPFSPNGCLLI